MVWDAIESKRSELKALCRRNHVRRLTLFGSATRSDFDPEQSDLDFLVEFEDLPPASYADAYFGLLEELEGLFGRRVDLVTKPSVKNPYLLEGIEATRIELYAA
jgi:predicted nucleotidyltransferase